MGGSSFDDADVDPSAASQDLTEVASTVPGASAPDTDEVAEFLDADALTGTAEVEGYWVRKPFAYVSVGYDEDEDAHVYRVVEPVLDEFERYVRDDLAAVVRNPLLDTVHAAAKQAARIESNPLGVEDVPVDAHRRLLYHAAILQATGNALLLGVLPEDRLATGVKYSCAYLALTGATLTVLGFT